MEYDDPEYPYSPDVLPDIQLLLEEIEWDVVCLFDACRWDAFEKICGSSEPVATPTSNPSEWVNEVWSTDNGDWNDVTYISGNEVTKEMAVTDQLGNYEELFNDTDVYDESIGTTVPRSLRRQAIHHTAPIVVHFSQPAPPFIGDLDLHAQRNLSATELEIPTDGTHSGEAQLVMNNYISLEMYRSAYLENLRLVWRAAERLGETFEKVITTTTHGTLLGPIDFSNGKHTNQGHVIPFHTNWDVTLPDPVSVGAANTHTWVTEPTRNSPEDAHQQNNTSDPIVDEELNEKLKALGYQI